jgi:hypothetical protein
MSMSPSPLPPRGWIRRSIPVAATVVAVLASGCNTSTTPAPTGSPGSPAITPSASPVSSPSTQPSTTGAIEHQARATDVVLRVESGGGFVPIDFLATQAPTFTLFGYGVVVFQPRVAQSPEPDANGVIRGTPWRTATLDEGQVQELLEFALGPGGLGGARDSYVAGGIADAPNTIFTIHAGGIDKIVTVNALNEEPQPGADAPARAAFWKLAARLQDFDDGGRIATDVFAPDRFRGVLLEREAQPGLTPIAWPWTDIPLSGFKPGPPDGSGPTTFPHRTLSAVEAAGLKLDGIEGGAQGIALKAPDGKVYGLVLRPLLGDETE